MPPGLSVLNPSKRFRDILYCLALLAEVAVFHRQVLFHAGYLFPWDFRNVHLPLATFVADSLRRGELPLWDPYTYCGSPIFANIQTALFYPPVLVATMASAWLGMELLPRLLAFTVALHVLLAGVTTYALLRRLGAKPAAAWTAGTMYELGCFFASQAEHMGAMQSAAWLPLAWWCVVELRAGFHMFWLVVLSLALSMSVLAGLPQVAVAVFGSVLLLAILMAVFRLARWKLPWQVLGAWGWALLIAAVEVIPTVELTRNSVAKYRAEWLGSGFGIRPGALISLLIPNYWNVFDVSKFRGPADLTQMYLYSSILGLALGLAALLWRPDPWRKTFGLLTVIATLCMLGDATPVGRAIFNALPRAIRIGIHFEFTMCVFSLGLAVLAGYGVNRLSNRWLRIGAAGIIMIDLLAVGSNRPFNTASLAVEPGITQDSLDGSREVVARLRSLLFESRPPYRFDTTDAPWAWLESAPVLRLPMANGCDPLAPERIIQFRLSFARGARWGACYHVEDVSSPVVGLANVRYLVSRTPPPGGLKPVAEIGGYRISEYTRTLPRFFMVSHILGASNLAEAAKMLHVPDFDPSRYAIVEAPSKSMAPALTIGTVEVGSYAPARIQLKTHSSGPSFLVASEAWYPGWEAVLDGRPVRLYITDVAFRGVAVPAGDHNIEMRFVPRILFWSALVSALAVLGAGAAALYPRARTWVG